MKNPIRQVFLALFCLTLTACGGGGGGSDDSGTSDGDSGGGGSNSGSSEGINPGVSGKFFYEDSKSAHLMDISSGEYSVVPNTDWKYQDERFPYFGSYLVSPFKDHNTFLITATDCRQHEEGNPISGMDTCVLSQTFDGNYLTDVVIEWEVSGRAKPSPDGQFFAVFRELDDDWLEIFDFNGNGVSGVKIPSSPFEWLADGRLIYIYEGRNFIITDPYSTNFSTSWSIPESFGEGNITRISASPDGTKVSFNFRTSGTLVSEYTTFWMLDVETGSLRQIATNAEGEDAFHASAWSPDGAQIAVLEGGATGYGPDSPGVSAVMYVLPTNSEEVLQVARVDESLRSPGVVMLKRYRSEEIPTTSSSNSVIEGFPDWQFDWLPE